MYEFRGLQDQEGAEGRRPLPRPQGRAGEAHRRRGRGEGVSAHPNRRSINMISYINKLNFQL